jgi:hypothetical protein
MKYLKASISVLTLLLILYGLAYKNIIAPEDKTSIFVTIADMAIPIFMGLSLVLMAIKRRSENKGKRKHTSSDRSFYSSIESAEEFNKRDEK